MAPLRRGLKGAGVRYWGVIAGGNCFQREERNRGRRQCRQVGSTVGGEREREGSGVGWVGSGGCWAVAWLWAPGVAQWLAFLSPFFCSKTFPFPVSLFIDFAY
jgi:hypothetical protein